MHNLNTICAHFQSGRFPSRLSQMGHSGSVLGQTEACGGVFILHLQFLGILKLQV